MEIKRNSDKTWDFITDEGKTITKGSKAAIYRARKKYIQNKDNAPKPLLTDTDIKSAKDAIPEQNTEIIEEPLIEKDVIEVEKGFEMPTLESMKAENAIGGDSVGKSDDAFLKAFSSAKVVKDKEGNSKIALGSIWEGATPIIGGILEFGDASLQTIAKKQGITLWDEDSRKTQRMVFIRVLSVVAPKTNVELDPTMILLVMVAWMYGFPTYKIFKATADNKKKSKVLPFEEVLEIDS